MEARHTICTLSLTRLSWARYRLVLLGVRQRTSLIGKIRMGGGDTDSLVNLVLSFLHEPQWRVSFSQDEQEDKDEDEERAQILANAISALPSWAR